MPNPLRSLFAWLKRRRPAFLRPSLDSRSVQRILQERLARSPEAVEKGNDVLTGVRIGRRLDANLSVIRQLVGDAPDLVVRELVIAGGAGSPSGARAAVVFFDTLSHAERAASQVIKPLLYDAVRDGVQVPADPQRLADWICTRMINTANVETRADLQQLVQDLCQGKTAVLVEGVDVAIVLDLVGYDTRNVEEPMGEPVVRGPRDGFVDSLQTNLSLIRRRIGSPLLRFDRMILGRWTQTPVVIAYIHGIADPDLVQEVRRRLSAIDVDGVIDTSYIEEFIEDTPYTVFPQVLNTERPDTVVANLLEGRVAILADGTPFALVVPTSLWALMNAAEDYYQRWDGATLVRMLRYALVALVVLLPSSYVAATTFHPEMLPSTMLISIAAAREAVPFSSFTEVLLMEITFEALREAGVRLPRPIGQTIGIVGAIVIGEAAVSAQIVSAPVVIIVAFTGISSFVIPHFNVGIGFRIARFYILLLAGSLGLLGISIGLMLLILHLISLRSFGQPYLAPVSPMRWSELADTFVRLPRWLMRRRPEPVRAPTRRRRDFPAQETGTQGEGAVRASDQG
ncbi:MAG TPA: spore germination protein [Limnochordales bacterium]|nr:spore germination protein [Limnochordales bacterium]